MVPPRSNEKMIVTDFMTGNNKGSKIVVMEIRFVMDEGDCWEV